MQALPLINHYSRTHPLFDMIRKIRHLTMRDWMITFDHMYRKANSCIDLLSCKPYSKNFNVKILHESPDDHKSLLTFLDMTRTESHCTVCRGLVLK